MVGLRFFGHYYLQLIPPLCLLTAAALSQRSPSASRTARSLFAALFAVAFSAAGYFMRPFGPEPTYQTVSRFLAAHTEHERPGARVGQRARDLLGVGRAARQRLITTNTFLAGNHPGRPPEDAAPEESDPEVWDWFFQDLDDAPAALHRRHCARRDPRRASGRRSSGSRACRRC